MTALLLGLPVCEPSFSKVFMASQLLLLVCPKTTCLSSSHGVSTVVMKNCDPLVSFPALAMEIQYGLCLIQKFSSSNHSPYIDFPPVPFFLVKSPPCIMNSGMILCKGLPVYDNSSPCSLVQPLQISTKLATVLGTTQLSRSRSTQTFSWLFSIVISSCTCVLS